MEVIGPLLLALAGILTMIDWRGATVLARWWRKLRGRLVASFVFLTLAWVALFPYLEGGEWASAEFGWYLARGYGFWSMYVFSWWLFHRSKFHRKKKGEKGSSLKAK